MKKKLIEFEDNSEFKQQQTQLMGGRTEMDRISQNENVLSRQN